MATCTAVNVMQGTEGDSSLLERQYNRIVRRPRGKDGIVYERVLYLYLRASPQLGKPCLRR
jgi:hypothetical protein